MRHFILISMVALGLVGCRHAPHPASDAALQIWRSPDSSLQQRADAVNKLIPPGTGIEEVERVLGKKGEWTRFWDPPVFRLVYEFSDGGVSLEFESSMAFGDRFWTASPVQTRYHNAQYGLSFFLPASWRGYSAIIQKWDGYPSETEHGPMIVLRHPQWTTSNPYQDIPILVFTRNQWEADKQGRFAIGAGGFDEEIGHNSKYVFAISSRFNAADAVKGWKEATETVERNRAASEPHLHPE